MKFFFFALTLALSAQAAKLEKTSAFKDIGLTAIQKCFNSVSETFDADHHSISTDGVKIITRSRSELPEQTIKQMIYVLRSSWGRHESVKVSTLNASEIDENMMLPLEQLLERDNEEDVPSIRAYQQTYKRVLRAGKYRLFKTEDATPYGGCSSTAIESLKTMEVLTLDGCWFE